MKFTLHNADTLYSIEAYSSDGIRIRGEHYKDSLIIAPDQLLDSWHCPQMEALSVGLLEPVWVLNDIELLILGTGAQQRFPADEIYRQFQQHKIPLEVMDSSAACRTYNVLASEGRYIAAAILPLSA